MVSIIFIYLGMSFLMWCYAGYVATQLDDDVSYWMIFAIGIFWPVVLMWTVIVTIFNGIKNLINGERCA